MDDAKFIWDKGGSFMGVHFESAKHYIDKGYLAIPINWVLETWAARQKHQSATASTNRANGKICPYCGGTGAMRHKELSLQSCSMCEGSGELRHSS